jgi:hypothetical protein
LLQRRFNVIPDHQFLSHNLDPHPGVRQGASVAHRRFGPGAQEIRSAAADLTPSPLRAITRISTACSWVNIDGTKKAVILAQVGHFYFGAVGQYYSGANN